MQISINNQIFSSRNKVIRNADDIARKVATEYINISVTKLYDLPRNQQYVNDLIQIGNDSQSNIGANKYVEVQELDTLSAKNIRLDADEKMLLYSKAHDQVSDDAMNIEGGKQLNCHANNIKIN